MNSIMTKQTKITQGTQVGGQHIFQGIPRKMVTEEPEPADAVDKSGWLKKDLNIIEVDTTK